MGFDFTFTLRLASSAGHFLFAWFTHTDESVRAASHFIRRKDNTAVTAAEVSGWDSRQRGAIRNRSGASLLILTAGYLEVSAHAVLLSRVSESSSVTEVDTFAAVLAG